MRAPPPIDIESREKARFSAAQRFAILLRQSTDGISRCEVCNEVIAVLSPDGHWMKQRPIDYDHEKARALGGRTHEENGRALCGHPFKCHKVKSASDAAMIAKADRMGGRHGSQYARRAERKARGLKPQIQGRGFRT